MTLNRTLSTTRHKRPYAGNNPTRPLATGNQTRMQGIFSECTQLCF
ncbi:hypothetical protein NC652_026987 [Populus alba x Populus x berolinensis]|nr:hypothetical protein NC652_026987 [Populus alba x Populus x berolinensis]